MIKSPYLYCFAPFRHFDHNPNAIELYNTLCDHQQNANKDFKHKNLAPLKAELEKSRERLGNARQLMLDKDIDAQEYREVKEEYEAKIRRIENQIRDMEVMNSSMSEQLQFSIQLLPNLARYYDT